MGYVVTSILISQAASSAKVKLYPVRRRGRSMGHVVFVFARLAFAALLASVPPVPAGSAPPNLGCR